MSIAEGSRLIPVMTADGKIAVLKGSPAKGEGDRAISVMTADGKQTLIKCSAIKTEGQRGIPVMLADGKVGLVRFAADPMVYVGGNFFTIGSDSRWKAGVVGASPDEAIPQIFNWDADIRNTDYFSYNVQSLILSGDVVYLGGNFNQVGGLSRKGLACVEADPEKVEPEVRDWKVDIEFVNPVTRGSVYTIILEGSDLYVGGRFELINGSSRKGLACVEADPSKASPSIHPWNPCSEGPFFVTTMSPKKSEEVGELTTRTGNETGTITMYYLDHSLTTGKRLDLYWDGGSRSEVVAGTVSGASVPVSGGAGDNLPVATTEIKVVTSNLYIGGSSESDRTQIYNQGRYLLALVEMDRLKDEPILFPWNPMMVSDYVFGNKITRGSVNALVISGENIYVGGSFNYIVEGNVTGSLTDISEDYWVADVLQIKGPTLYDDIRLYQWIDISGTSHFDGHYFVSATDGSGGYRVSGENSIHTGRSQELSGSYTGRDTTNAIARKGVACVEADPDKADPTWFPWDLELDHTGRVNPSVRSLLMEADNIFIGGRYNTIRGEYRLAAACVEADPSKASPSIHPWNPIFENDSAYIEEMKIVDGNIFLGGVFTGVSGEARGRLACIDADPGIIDPDIRPWNPNFDGNVLAFSFTE